MSYNIRDIETGEIIKIADVGGGGGNGNNGNSNENSYNTDLLDTFSKCKCVTPIKKQVYGFIEEAKEDYPWYRSTIVKVFDQPSNTKEMNNKIYCVKNNYLYLVLNNEDYYLLQKTNIKAPSDSWDPLEDTWTDGEDFYYNDYRESKIYNKETKEWEDIVWENQIPDYGKYVWSDGENLYYSSGYSNRGQYKFNKETRIWEPIEWNCVHSNTSFYGYNVFVDGEDVYYFSDKTKQYKLNKETNTWELLNWSIDTNNLEGKNVWRNKKNIYYSYNSSQYKLDKENNIWNKMDLNEVPYSKEAIYTDGVNFYFRQGSSEYKFNQTTEIWEPRTEGFNYAKVKLSVPTSLKWIYGDLYSSLGSGAIYRYNTGYSIWEQVSYICFPKGTEISGFWSDGTDQYYSNGTDQYYFDTQEWTWKEKNWNGLTNFYGSRIWSDGTDFYYTTQDVSTHYKLNKTNSTWNSVTMTFGSEMKYHFYPSYIWTDGTTAYYDDYDPEGLDAHYKFNKSTLTWTKSDNGIQSGYGVWSDGENLYYHAYDCGQYYDTYLVDMKYNKTTKQWENIEWNIDFVTAVFNSRDDTAYAMDSKNTLYTLNKANTKWELSGYTPSIDIWTDGENIYSNDFIFNNKYWEKIAFNCGDDFSSGYIWCNGENIYYSDGNTKQFEFDKEEKDWKPKVWYGAVELGSGGFWNDGEHLYHTDGLMLNEDTGIWKSSSVAKSIPRIYSSYIWTDGENIYYSNGSSGEQLKLNKETGEWESVTWFGDILESSYQLSGQNIWTDYEGNIYLSSNAWSDRTDYILDKDAMTWSLKEWKKEDGSKFRIGEGNLWKDGENIYYSYGDSQFVLLDDTTWSPKTWNIGNFNASDIWSFEDEIYCSYRDNNEYKHYKLDQRTKSWKTTSWNVSDFTGSGLWKYKDDLYYSSKYKLNKETYEWEVLTWGGCPAIRGGYIWSDGENIYHTNSINHQDSDYYKLNKETDTWEPIVFTVEENSVQVSYFSNANIWSDGEDVFYTNYDSWIFNKENLCWQTKDFGIRPYKIWTDRKNIFTPINTDNNYIFNPKTKKFEPFNWISSDPKAYFYDVIPWTDGRNYYLGNYDKKVDIIY